MRCTIPYHLLMIFLATTLTTLAQLPCNEQSLLSIKGSWKKHDDASPFPDKSFPSNQFSFVNDRIDRMQKILQTAYPKPKGMEASWYRSISGNALVPGGPVPYDLSSMMLPYYCNGKTS